jgi:uncharacterized membrane protein YdbT with pleckstrin-like domain
VLIGRLLPPAALLVLWLGASLLGMPALPSTQPHPLAPVLCSVWAGITCALVLWAVYALFDWMDDWIALTTRRIIIMDKLRLLRETRREVPLARVQNVVVEYPNLLNKVLDFGTLMVDTAGVGLLTFAGLPQPHVMREAIFAQQAALRSTQLPPEHRRRAAIRNILAGGQAPHQRPAQPADLSDRPTPPSGIVRPGQHPHQPGKFGATQLLDTLLPIAPLRYGDVVVWHRHWYFLLRGLLWPTALYGAALIAWFATMALTGPGMSGHLELILGWVVIILTPVCMLWAVWNWENWRNELYKLDREHVYLVESLPFGLREQSRETLISRITDVTYVVPGPLAHLFNFGDVIINTPGESVDFSFRGIARPREVQQEIMARLDAYRLKETAGLDEEIGAWLKAYHEVLSEQLE